MCSFTLPKYHSWEEGYVHGICPLRRANHLVHVGRAGYHMAEVGIKGTKMIFEMNVITGLESWLSHQRPIIKLSR